MFRFGRAILELKEECAGPMWTATGRNWSESQRIVLQPTAGDVIASMLGQREQAIRASPGLRRARERAIAARRTTFSTEIAEYSSLPVEQHGIDRVTAAIVVDADQKIE